MRHGKDLERWQFDMCMWCSNRHTKIEFDSILQTSTWPLPFTRHHHSSATLCGWCLVQAVRVLLCLLAFFCLCSQTVLVTEHSGTKGVSRHCDTSSQSTRVSSLPAPHYSRCWS